MEDEITTTARGFGLVKFRDHNGVECSLQQSSAIDMESEDGLENPGSSYLWLGCVDADPQMFIPNGDPSWQRVPMPEQYIANTRMHLDRRQVVALIEHLRCWLETGHFESDVLDAEEIE